MVFDVNVILSKTFYELDALVDGHNIVGFSMDHKKRRRTANDMSDGTCLPIVVGGV
jgi:hypothetical protein